MSLSVTFDVSESCFTTGIVLKAGENYRIDVDTAGSVWSDGQFTAGLDGFASVGLVPWTPLRRKLSEPWLKLIGQIGNGGNEYFIVGPGHDSYQARSNGELFLYVNDAVFGYLPEPYWAWPYYWNRGRNVGNAAVSIAQLEYND